MNQLEKHRLVHSSPKIMNVSGSYDMTWRMKLKWKHEKFLKHDIVSLFCNERKRKKHFELTQAQYRNIFDAKDAGKGLLRMNRYCTSRTIFQLEIALFFHKVCYRAKTNLMCMPLFHSFKFNKARYTSLHEHTLKLINTESNSMKVTLLNVYFVGTSRRNLELCHSIPSFEKKEREKTFISAQYTNLPPPRPPTI